MNQTKEIVSETLLDPMLRAATAGEFRAALRELQKSKRLASAAKLPGFRLVLERVSEIAATPGRNVERLTALAVLARIQSALRGRVREATRALDAAGEHPMPALSLVSDPDDRLAIATVLADSSVGWITPYLATSIVSEDAAEKTREELVGALLRSASLSSGLVELASALEAFSKNTAATPTNSARKLRRILVALRKRLPRVDNAAGQSLGAAVKNVLGSPFRLANAPSERAVIAPLAEEAIGFLHDVLRAQPVALTDPDVYAAIAIPKGWFQPALWTNWVARSASAKTLLRDLTNGIVILGKQGVMSNALRDWVSYLTGSSDIGRKVLREIGQQNADLPIAVRHWLERGDHVPTTSLTEVFEESSLLGADHQLAKAVLVARKLAETLASQNTDIPRATVADLADEVSRLGTSRRLRVVGSPGDIVPFSAHAHELIGGSTTVTRVRIVRPLVERSNAAGHTDVLLRAIVEACD